MGQEGSKTGGASSIPEGTNNIKDIYEFGDVLGRGHFAEVVRAKDKRTGRQVAIKRIIKKELGKNASAVKSEVEILKTVGNHPHVVNLIDTFDDENHYYLIMEFCTGGDLFNTIIDQGQFSENDARRFCRQLAEAIMWIHRCGITHRDLKPENILLSSKDLKTASLKVADFGLSKIIPEPSSQMKTVCGTWAYCAPEVITKRPYTQAVDNWTLGVLMFVLLSGYHPFDMYGDLPEAKLMRNIKSCKYDFEDDVWKPVSESAKQLIRDLLVVDPAKRMSCEGFLKSDWILHDGADRDMTYIIGNLKNQNTKHSLRALVNAKLAASHFRKYIANRETVPKEKLHQVFHEIRKESGHHSPASAHNVEYWVDHEGELDEKHATTAHAVHAGEPEKSVA